MDKKILADEMGVPLSTVYSWEKSKIKLMKLVKLGLKYKEGIKKEENETMHYFEQLSKDEQEMYLAEMKARVLRKKIEK